MKRSIIHIGVQYFAEPGEAPAEAGVQTPSEAAAQPPKAGEGDPPPAVEKPEKAYSRDEVNRIIAAETAKALEAFQARQSEAEKLSKMKQDERIQYEKEQAEKRAADAIAELNAYKLKDEAVKIAGTEGLPLPFLSFMDFRTLSAEQVDSGIREMAAEYKRQVMAGINGRLKQPPPESTAAQGASQLASEAAQYARSYSGFNTGKE